MLLTAHSTNTASGKPASMGQTPAGGRSTVLMRMMSRVRTGSWSTAPSTTNVRAPVGIVKLTATPATTWSALAVATTMPHVRANSLLKSPNVLQTATTEMAVVKTIENNL